MTLLGSQAQVGGPQAPENEKVRIINEVNKELAALGARLVRVKDSMAATRDRLLGGVPQAPEAGKDNPGGAGSLDKTQALLALADEEVRKIESLAESLEAL